MGGDPPCGVASRKPSLGIRPVTRFASAGSAGPPMLSWAVLEDRGSAECEPDASDRAASVTGDMGARLHTAPAATVRSTTDACVALRILAFMTYLLGQESCVCRREWPDSRLLFARH